jgi:hypothetical protein
LSKPVLTIEQLERNPYPPLDVVHLMRWPLHTAYPQVIADVVELLARPQLAGATLAADATGVGRPCCDMLRTEMQSKTACALVPITITSGAKASRDDEAGGFRAPKAELVKTLRKLLRGYRLRVAEALPEAATMVRELGAFEMRISEAVNETFGAQSGKHDDLLLATMLAAWIGENGSAR